MFDFGVLDMSWIDTALLLDTAPFLPRVFFHIYIESPNPKTRKDSHHRTQTPKVLGPKSSCGFFEVSDRHYQYYLCYGLISFKFLWTRLGWINSVYEKATTTLGRLTFSALYFSRIVLEFFSRTLHLARGDNSRNKEDNSGICLVLLCIQISDLL